jgi:hypothetical protein
MDALEPHADFSKMCCLLSYAIFQRSRAQA